MILKLPIDIQPPPTKGTTSSKTAQEKFGETTRTDHDLIYACGTIDSENLMQHLPKLAINRYRQKFSKYSNIVGDNNCFRQHPTLPELAISR